VVGVDADSRKVDAINRRRALESEPGLEALLQKHDRLRATDSIDEAVHETDVTFVTVQTPPRSDGILSQEQLLIACASIGTALAKKHDPHIVAITSTVMPGTTGGVVTEMIAGAAGEAAYAIVFIPEFVALGTAIQDFQSPDFVLIGEAQPGSAPELDELFARVCTSRPVILRADYASAELAKLAINAFLAVKVNFANALGELCEHLGGCEVDTVTRIVGADSRVGSEYLTAAMPFGGPCLPRDVSALSALACAAGASALFWDAVSETNSRHAMRIAQMVEATLPGGGCVGIYGLGFKPGSGVTEQSPAAALAEFLIAREVRTIAFDPNARAAAACPGLELVASLDECAARADVLVLTAPLGSRKLPARRLNGRPKVVVDCWRSVSPTDLADAHYIAVGRPTADPLSAARARADRASLGSDGAR